MNILDWWIQYQPLNEEEKKILTTDRVLDYKEVVDSKYQELCKQYFDRMLFSNINCNNRKLTFSNQATDFINQLFDKYVDDETLVITTNGEHDNVYKKSNECKNVLILNYKTDIKGYNLFKIRNKISDFKKVFVYIVGVQISSGEITPQLFLEELKKILVKNNKQHIMVCDDVHGMFFLPRDYTIFDYVIGTGHGFISAYNVGMLVSKNGDLGYKAYNWGIGYLKAIDTLLTRKDKMKLFTPVLEEYFSEYIAMSNFSLLETTSPHIFSLKTTGLNFPQSLFDTLKDYKVRLEGIGQPYTLIRLRAQEMIIQPELVMKGLKILNGYLKIITNNF